MGVSDFNSSGFDADASAYNRQNRVNPPEFAPGQGDNSLDDIFGNSSFTTQPVQNNNSIGDVFNNTVNNGGILGASNPMMGGQQPQIQQKSDEDRFYEILGKVFNVTKDVFIDYVQSFGKVTAFFWSELGMHTLILGLVFAVGGILLRLFGLKVGLSFTVGGFISSGIGSILWLFLYNSGKECTSRYKEDNSQADGVEEQDPFNNTESSLNSESNTFANDFDDFGDDSDDDFSTGFGDEEDDFDDFDWDDAPSSQPSDGESLDTALENMPELNKGMYTRQFLYEQFTKVLPCYEPNFATMREYDEDDENFLFWCDKLQEAALASGMKEDYLPELESLKENLFTIEFKCDRPQGFKPEAIAQELANIYTYEMGKDSTVAFNVKPVGMNCFITLYTGDSAMISLKDMYNKRQDFILDAKNFLPVVIGVGTSGSVYTVDLKKVESMLVTGMPRSGKTWFVQCLLYQMCSLASPSDINLYILDPKDGISDYKRLYIPHIKKFEQTDEGVLKTLRYIVRVEGAKRKKLLGDAGFVKIWDYKERYPDVKLPIIYLVIDEMVSFAGRMDKETKAEFRALLRELVSQLPALGIRAIMIPHIVKDEFIEKSTSDLIMCRISVRGDAGHIEQSTGAKPREFKHKLTNVGDMAVRLAEISSDVTFIHSPVLTNSSVRNEELFDYMRRVWSTLEPESMVGSYAENAEGMKEQEEILENLRVDNIMDDDELF